MKYSENIDYLVSSILYLGTHADYWARTPGGLAKEISVDEDRLRAVFEGFPSIYRRSPGTDEKGQYRYSLQARYARREGRGQEPKSIALLTTDRMQMVLDFVHRMTEHEQSGRQVKWTNYVSVMAAVIAAVTALAVAFGK